MDVDDRKIIVSSAYIMMLENWIQDGIGRLYEG